MSAKVEYLILGAGPTGLTVANRLLDKGIENFVVLEAETEAGGLCRSNTVDNSPFDIGGGHFLDVRNPRVTEYLFRFMPREEWNFFERDSRIVIGNNIIHHPFEANLWELDIDSQIEYLKSVAAAGCNTGKPQPALFIDWIRWKLGNKIADNYMLPYNSKMFGNDLNKLGTYWLNKLPDVSFEDTLRSCLTHHTYARQPGHARFYYPKKYGYGELWNRMADRLDKHIIYSAKVDGLDCNNITVTTSNGKEYTAQKIITTIPWMEFKSIIGAPNEIISSISQLRYSTIQTEYHAEHLDTEAHWIYYPDMEISYHRILVRHNFCPGSKGYWTETNCERLIGGDKTYSCNISFVNKYAYPLNTINKPEIMNRLLSYMTSRNIIGIGRWGEHSHFNSDRVVESAMTLTDSL